MTAEILAAGGPRGRRSSRKARSRAPPTSACASARPTRSSTRSAAGRQTQDKSITILQGRCVGGSTTVNWTSSFRTPAAHARALARRRTGSQTATKQPSRPGSRAWKSASRSRPGRCAPNENNDILRRGCEKLGMPVGRDPPQREGLLEPRLLRHGLPDQRQAVDARDHDPGRARPRRHARAPRARRAARARKASAIALAKRAASSAAAPRPAPHRIRLRARHFVLAAGAIGIAGDPAAQRACPIRTSRRAGARSCIPRWSRPR